MAPKHGNPTTFKHRLIPEFTFLIILIKTNIERSYTCFLLRFVIVAGRPARDGQPGFDRQQMQEVFCLPACSDCFGPTHPSFQWPLGVFSRMLSGWSKNYRSPLCGSDVLNV
jgi:hypothetical protein